MSLSDNQSLYADYNKKPKKRVKIIKTSCFVVLAAILLTLTVNSLLYVFIEGFYPTFGDYRLFAVVTDSMNPEIPAGHMIVSKVPKSADEISVGDVITFEVRSDNSVTLITHRVQTVSVSEDGRVSYTTKGDNARGTDSVRPTFSDVVGVYTGRQCGFFGYFFGFLQSTTGAIALIIIVFIIALTCIIVRYVNFVTVWRSSALCALKKSGAILSSTSDDALGAIADVIGIVSKEPKDKADLKRKDKKLGWFIRTGTLPKRPYSDDLDERAIGAAIQIAQSDGSVDTAMETAAVQGSAEAPSDDHETAGERPQFTVIERCEAVRYEYTFSARLIQLKSDVKEWYSAVKNELLSFERVRVRTTKRGETFMLGRNTVAVITVRGKTLCLMLAVDPSTYANTKYAVTRVRSKSSKTPCMYKIKSERRAKYACELINDVLKDRTDRKRDYIPVDYFVPYEGVWTLMRKGLVKRRVNSEQKAYRIEEIDE